MLGSIPRSYRVQHCQSLRRFSACVCICWFVGSIFRALMVNNNQSLNIQALQHKYFDTTCREPGQFQRSPNSPRKMYTPSFAYIIRDICQPLAIRGNLGHTYINTNGHRSLPAKTALGYRIVGSSEWHPRSLYTQQLNNLMFRCRSQRTIVLRVWIQLRLALR